MQDVKNILQVHDLESGKFLYKVPLAIGSIDGVHGRKKSNELFFKFSSMVNPGVIYYLDMSLDSPVPQVFRETVIEGLDTSMFELDQVFFESKDGTKVPMFIASRKGLVKRDGTTPCLLYGYGGFNVSFMPSFGITRLFFAKHFGYFVLANLRGGGEYGEAWHNAGRLFNKQNVFDDFHSASEFLIRERYTSKDKLAIQGGSNGGLLVGACCNQRPDLYGAGIAQVGVMDMLRFHKFTIGHAWCSDYGNPDEKAHFENNLKYSPLHNIREPEKGGQYPAMLLTTADHDDRVVPSHTLKFVAELQNKIGRLPQQTNPLMVRVDTKAGHGMGKPTSKLIEEVTEIYCFLVLTLGYKFID
jgi:prolyl oligopeptidase